jgi:hypothetical protein
MNIRGPALKYSVWGEVKHPVDRSGRSVDGQRLPQNFRLIYYAITGNAIAEGETAQNKVFDQIVNNVG